MTAHRKNATFKYMLAYSHIPRWHPIQFFSESEEEKKIIIFPSFFLSFSMAKQLSHASDKSSGPTTEPSPFSSIGRTYFGHRAFISSRRLSEQAAHSSSCALGKTRPKVGTRPFSRFDAKISRPWKDSTSGNNKNRRRRREMIKRA